MATIKSKQLESLSKRDEERYWSNVERDSGGCWNWTGSKSSKGYGRFFAKGQHHSAHRLAWLLAGRAIQPDLLICHTCDNRQCVNPGHLIMGDAATNNRDAMLKRNLAGKHARVKKPHEGFPLFPHATRRWAKKVRGRLVYFGRTVDDPTGDAALAKWLDQKDDLLAGRTPRAGRDGLTVRDLVNRFLTAKQQQRDAGELSATMFADYHATCGEITEAFGLTRLADDLAADDFEALRAVLGKRLGPVALGNRIQRIRTVFKYGYEAGLIDKPVRFGPQFKKPNRRIVRLAKQAKGAKVLSAVDVYRLVAYADQPLKAMFLLAVNCGFGNADCGTLPLSALDLSGGWVNFPRRKTGIPRRCKLWPETVAALREAIAKRPKPKDDADAGLCFVTKYGAAWYAGKPGGPVTNEAIKVFKALGLHSAGRGFYTLRHVFQTIGDEAKDPVATRAIMGHVDDSMSGAYREGVSDDRLAAVANHVRKWLFPPKKRTPPERTAAAKAKETPKH